MLGEGGVEVGELGGGEEGGGHGWVGVWGVGVLGGFLGGFFWDWGRWGRDGGWGEI